MHYENRDFRHRIETKTELHDSSNSNKHLIKIEIHKIIPKQCYFVHKIGYGLPKKERKLLSAGNFKPKNFFFAKLKFLCEMEKAFLDNFLDFAIRLTLLL